MVTAAPASLVTPVTNVKLTLTSVIAFRARMEGNVQTRSMDFHALVQLVSGRKTLLIISLTSYFQVGVLVGPVILWPVLHLFSWQRRVKLSRFSV
jgi:hypothetical protein